MTAQQIQTIGNALAVDLVAWGRRRSGSRWWPPAPPGCCGCSLSARPALVGESCSSVFGQE